MNSPTDLARMVPGFEFLQNLMKGAGASLPGVQGFGQWIAPTLDPEEIEKRIQELKTVQFWLEQNARLLGTTVQALEVQRMTLATLKTMNLPMTDLRDALKARPPEPPAAAPVPAPQASPPAAAAKTQAKIEAKVPAIDPMQWWSALTQQFTELATKAVKDSSATADRPPRKADAALAGAARKPARKPAPKAASPRARKA